MTHPVLTLGTSAIRQLDGLYSLNDLHRAAGGEETHRPNQFIRLDQTQALVAEIETAQMCAVKTKEGRNGGTYVCRELVYAYAMWISPKFNLAVIRAFDALYNQPALPEKPARKSLGRSLREEIRQAVQEALFESSQLCLPAVPASDDLTQAMEAKLRRARFLVSHANNGTMVLVSIGDDEFIASPEKFCKTVGDPGGSFPRHLLPALIQAAAKRLENT